MWLRFKNPLPPPQNLLRFVGWFYCINALLFCILGIGYLQNILLSPALFVNGVANYTSIGGRLFVGAFALVNYLWYMMVLGFFPAVLLAVLAYVIPVKRVIIGCSVLIASMSVLLLLMNNYIYALYKFHINGAVAQLFINSHIRDVFDLSNQELTSLLFLSAFIVLIESGIAYFVWGALLRPKKYFRGTTIASLWVGGFFFSYFSLLYTIAQHNNLLSQQTPNLPFYRQIMAFLIPEKNADDILYRYSETHFTQAAFSQDPLRYPRHPMQCRRPKVMPNIIFILVDALRFDSVQKHYMPHVAHFSEKSWNFMQHVSGGNATQPGLFALFYSIPANYWTAAQDQRVAPILLQTLRAYGYIVRAFWSSDMRIPPFDKTIFLGVSHIDFDGAPGNDVGSRDKESTERARAFLAQKPQQPFFLSLFYDAAHGYCREQRFSGPFSTAVPACNRMAMNNTLDPKPYYHRYLNAVHFIDGEIARVLESIEQHGYLNNSIVLISSDHGEEFNDNKQNYWGHAGNFTHAQVHIPLIIHWPESTPRLINYQTTSYDVIPTLMQRVFQCSNPVHDYSIGQDVLQEHGRMPFVLAGSYSNMGIIEPKRLTTLRSSGGLYVTNERAEVLPNEYPAASTLKKALTLMRYYFAHPK